MATSPETPAAPFTLSAKYTSATGNEPFTITSTTTITTPGTPLEQKTAYLQSLRSAVLYTQEQINKELTARMEEDNAKAAAAGGNSKAALNDAKEEENYGEEMQEDD